MRFNAVNHSDRVLPIAAVTSDDREIEPPGASLSVTVVERKPPREFVREKNQQKKVIIKKTPDKNDGADSEGWIEARDPSKMSAGEKQENIRIAKQEYSNSRKSTNPKLSDTAIEADDKGVGRTRLSYESEEGSPESISKLDQIRIDRDSLKKKEREHRSIKRLREKDLVKDENKRSKKSSSALGDASDASDSDVSDHSQHDEDLQDTDNDAEADEWRVSDKTNLQSKVKRLMNHCENVGRNLRSHIRKWSGRGSSKSPVASAGDSISLCTDSLIIAVDYTENVLRDDYFKIICPGLVLKPYQLVGVNWLKLLHENNVNGILADDMGLGKTVQSIALIAWLKMNQSASAKRKAHFIVVPASTLANWENELKRFCPSLVVVTYHGTQDERADLRYDLRKDFEAGTVDVLLSTFTIFERESGKEDRFMNLNEVKAAHRLLLSGTPVQNDIKELLALMSFTMPDVFKKIGIDEVLDGFGWDEKSSAPSSSSSAVSIDQLRSMLAPFVLRRVKSDVLDQLVDKVAHTEKVCMTAFQASVYDNILSGHLRRKEKIKAKAASQLAYENSLKCPVKGQKNKKIPNNTQSNKAEHVINNDLVPGANETLNIVEHELSASEAAHLFTALRKAANHPLLLRVRYQDEKVMVKIAETCYAEGRFGRQCDFQRVRDEIDKFSDFDLHQLCLEFPAALGHLQLEAETLYDSQKMQKLKEMLPVLVEEGHRVLIFSQWTRLLDLLEVLLNDMGMEFLRLDGSTPVKDRQELIDEFSEEGSPIPVFLLSTKAGGLGINLTSADTVIMHDLDFNPENDRQAEDRCHRIGQTRAVTVFRLVTTDTVDEDIYLMGERKRKLTSAVLSDHHSPEGKKGKGRPKSIKDDENEEDIGAIGRILQRALQRNQKKNERAASDGNMSATINKSQNEKSLMESPSGLTKI